MITRRFLGALTAGVLLFSLGTVHVAHAATDPCLHFIPKQYADADYKADAIYHRCRSLHFLKDLNALRARTDRTPLTPELIARARTEDFEAEYKPESIDPRTADGSAVPALRVNSDLNKWAQHRANELAAIDGLDHHHGIANGSPSWYVVKSSADALPNLATSPNYTFGTLMFGPEALAWVKVTRKADNTPLPALPGVPDGWNPIDEWYSELHATGTPEQLKEDRQAYGHYLTEVSHLVNVAGFGVAQNKQGSTVAVLEVGYIDPAQESGKGETLTVDEAIAKLSAPSTSPEESAGAPQKDESKADTDASTDTDTPNDAAHSNDPADAADAGASNSEGDGAGEQGGSAGEAGAPSENGAGQPGDADHSGNADQSAGTPNVENSTTPDASAHSDTPNTSGDAGTAADPADNSNSANNANVSHNAGEKHDGTNGNDTAADSSAPKTQAGADSGKTAHVVLNVTQTISPKARAAHATPVKPQEAAPVEAAVNNASIALAQTGSSAGELALLSMAVLAAVGMALLSIRGLSLRGRR